MKVPEGMTEQEVLDIIDRVANGLAYKFKFGYYEADDIKQHARMEAILGLEGYDAEKGKLETFLWTHVRNRLSNLKRNKFERYDKPCLNCPLNAYDPKCKKSKNECTEYEDKDDCKLYYNWLRRNSAKRNIVSPIGIHNVRDENESNMRKDCDIVEQINYSTMVDLIDSKIPVNLRSLWIRMKNDIKLNKAEREKLLAAIRTILAEENYDS